MNRNAIATYQLLGCGGSLLHTTWTRGSDDYGGSIDFYSVCTVHLHSIIFYVIKYIGHCGAMDFAISKMITMYI